MWSRKAQDAAGWYSIHLKTGEDYDHSIAMSRHFDFYESRVLDCFCSYRTDGTQMTGTRDFTTDIIKIYKKWRHTAINKDWVIENQNNSLRQRGINPEDFGL